MKTIGPTGNLNRAARLVLTAACLILFSFGNLNAHPLGNFTINHFARLEVGTDKIKLRYVVDMAEIPTFQELQSLTTNGGDPPNKNELDAFAARKSARYSDGLLLVLDGARLPLRLLASRAVLVTGAGGLQTLRIESDLAATIPVATQAVVRRLRFEDQNYSDRIGWRELVVTPLAGTSLFDCSAYGTNLTDELKAYPSDMLTAPLDERTAELSFAGGVVPNGAHALLARDGRPVAAP
ncbi:MAG: hypothetical protein ABJB61_01260, partial [bacterium]